MNNRFTLVGRIVKIKTVKIDENVKHINVTLAIPRCYKNVDGVYETDFISIKLLPLLSESVQFFCEGDLIGVAGRISNLRNDRLELIAERVSFLASAKDNENKGV